MPKFSADMPTERIGDLFLRSYDEAIFRKIGAVLSGGDGYFASVVGVTPPSYSDDNPDDKLRRQVMPGVPVNFYGPNEAIVQWVNPGIVIRRGEPILSMERWAEGKLKYCKPADTATAMTVNLGKMIPKKGSPVQIIKSGYDKYETQRWPWPYDLHYTVLARSEGVAAEAQAAAFFLHFLKKLPPRDSLRVEDSLGIDDGFAMFVDGPTDLSEAIDIGRRVRGWAWNVRVVGYLDSYDAEVSNAVLVPPVPNVKQKEDE